MRRKTYPAGQRFELLHVETLYRTLDAGLCCGVPVAAGCGVQVDCIEIPSRVIKLDGSDQDRLLCRAEIDGAPAYGWLLLSWLEPINPQRSLFEVSQPRLF